jgi:alanine dehydrogenase
MPLFIDDNSVKSLVDMRMVIAAVEAAFQKQARGENFNLPRHRFKREEVRLNVMLAGDSIANRYAMRAYGSLGKSISHVLLYGVEGLLAVIDARTLSSLRTGAATAVAAKYLARPAAQTVGIVGAGRQAEFQLVALQAVRPLSEVRVFARNRANLEEFCKRMASRLTIPVRAAACAQAAAAGADIVIAATTSKDPILFADWIKPGACVIGMGANAADRRELDPAIITGADIVVTDDLNQAKSEAAEFIELANAGLLDWSRVVSLGDLIASPVKPGAGFNLFKSLGAAIEDLAAASMVYDEAMRQGAGSVSSGE